jgi:hypothetical protein
MGPSAGCLAIRRRLGFAAGRRERLQARFGAVACHAVQRSAQSGPPRPAGCGRRSCSAGALRASRQLESRIPAYAAPQLALIAARAEEANPESRIPSCAATRVQTPPSRFTARQSGPRAYRTVCFGGQPAASPNRLNRRHAQAACVSPIEGAARDRTAISHQTSAVSKAGNQTDG